MDLDNKDIEWVTIEIMKIADICCSGRVVSVLEGGYGSVNPNYVPKTGGTNRARTRASETKDDDQDGVFDDKIDSPINRDILSAAAASHVHKLIDPYNGIPVEDDWNR
jgi:acetoin utilization deacetylase AcuC-like enzyme